MCFDNQFTTKYCSIEIKIDRGVKIIAIPFILCIVIDMKTDIEISMRTAVNPRPPMSFDLYFLAILNSRRNGDANVFTVYCQHLLMRFVNIRKVQLQLSVIIFTTEFGLLLPVTTASHIAKHGIKKI